MIYKSNTYDPYRNLAAEELLMMAERESTDLYVWRNSKTVVVGKHQNAWAECNTQALEERDGGHLARRLSGGGAVYHDVNNLNFTFFVPKSQYDLGRQTGVILDAARSLGINAEKTGRNDLTVDGKKFSGNAFCFKGEKAYHHGTIMIDVDVPKMVEYLTVDPEKIISKGIASVRSRVINLAEVCPGLTPDIMEQALCTAFLKEYGGSSIIHDIEELKLCGLDELTKKYSSWEWKYGESPRFDVKLKNRATWGGMEIYLSLHDGVINNVTVHTDAMDTSIAEELLTVLKGCTYKKDEMLKRIACLTVGDDIKKDIAAWITEL